MNLMVFGVYNWPNGKYYEGEFKNGNSHGNGKMIWRTGFTFVGEFLNDSPTGSFSCLVFIVL